MDGIYTLKDDTAMFLGLPDDLREVMENPEISDELASELITKIDDDRNSMDDYIRQYENAIELAKMEHKGDKTFPFVKASKVMLPFLMEAAVEFNARATPEIVRSKTPCKAYAHNEDVAKRAATAINALCTRKIVNWRSDSDRLLLILPMVGTVFRKTWMDPSKRQIKSKLIWADELIFDHDVDVFTEARRHSHEYDMTKNEVVTEIRLGHFDMEISDILKNKEDTIEFIESHCWLDLDEDDFEEPYIATIHKETNKVVSIIARFDEEAVKVNEDGEVVEIDSLQVFSQTIFLPDPFGSCMGLGYGIILSDYYETLNTNIRQLLDAGTLQNVGQNSGFIRQGALSGPRMRNRQAKGNVSMILGQFTSIESFGTSPLANDIVNFPFSGPSNTLFQLFEAMRAWLKDFTNRVTEPNPNEAADLYLSRLQQAMKVPVSIMARVFDGFTQEFRLIADIIDRYVTDEEYSLLIGEEGVSVEEIRGADVMTTADPSQGSEQERQARAVMIYQKSVEDPKSVFDHYQVTIDLLVAMGVENPERVAPKPTEMSPEAQMQQAYLQIEDRKSQADMMRAQASMETVKIKGLVFGKDMMEMEAKIEKMAAEALKALKEAGAVEQEAVSAGVREVKETFEKMRDIYDNLEPVERVAGPSGNASLPGNPPV